MVHNQLKPVVNYWRRDKKLDETNLKSIRDKYQQLLPDSADHSNRDEPDESVIEKVAGELHLSIDTEESRDYLYQCVKYQDIKDAILVVSGMIAGEVLPLNESLFLMPSFSFPAASLPTPSHVTNDSEQLVDIKCLFNINIRTTDVDVFIRSFLLKKIEELTDPSSSGDNSNSLAICHDEQFILSRDCLLDLFIRHQMSTRGIIRSIGYRNSTHLRLIEPISSIDDFSAWQYDRWYGIFDFHLVPYGDRNEFPTRWSLADNARIHCHLRIEGSQAKSSNSLLIDRPRTASLDVFVHDICIRENNGQGDAWLQALHNEDILTFEQLTKFMSI